MLSPWTLPGGLPVDSSRGLRPRSRRMSWLAASEIASPMAAGEKPSASAAAAASAACSGVDLKIVWLSWSTQLSSAARAPGERSRSLCCSSNFGSSVRGWSRVAVRDPDSALTQ